MTPSLWFRNDSRPGPQVALPDGPCVVGRDESADLVIPADAARFVSRRHARLSRTEHGVVIEDLGSANGTWVNGQRIDRATLSDGDEVQFGRHGPVARFHADLPPTMAGEPLAHASASGERPSALVRRAVAAAMATRSRGERRRLVAVALSVILVTTLLVVALLRTGWLTRDPAESFAHLAAAYEPRIALIEVGVTQGDRYVGLSVGSGFFVGDAGLVITSKHVVQPQLFSLTAACSLASTSAPAVPDVTLWMGGTAFRRDPGSPTSDRDLGYSMTAGTLALVATAPDVLLPARPIECTNSEGRTFTVPWEEHAADSNDLALLRVMHPAPPPGIPLASADPAPGDLVMVYGFPTGFGPLEGVLAEPIFRVGTVLRARETVQTDAVVLHGNSGGPLINLAGEVVGVATRGPAESLNSAIKVEHVQRLLALGRGPE